VGQDGEHHAVRRRNPPNDQTSKDLSKGDGETGKLKCLFN
jgi:hypothetical protein